MEKSKVYFTKKIESSSLIKLYEVLNVKLPGNIAVKLHSGEEGNQNYLKPEFVRDLIEHVRGTVVECNTAYEGERNTTKKHLELIKKHGWSKYFNVDILDSKNEIILKNPNGEKITENIVGANLTKYDSMLVLSHFKGHPSGGYGGALKNISIGLASSRGKRLIHSSGNPDCTFDELLNADHDSFLISMTDAAETIIDFYGPNIIYINVLVNLSVDCDCCAVASDPCMADIGIMASCDPVALDKACIDLIYNSTDPGRFDLIERIESRNGLLTIKKAEEKGLGSTTYKLINID